MYPRMGLFKHRVNANVPATASIDDGAANATATRGGASSTRQIRVSGPPSVCFLRLEDEGLREKHINRISKDEKVTSVAQA